MYARTKGKKERTPGGLMYAPTEGKKIDYKWPTTRENLTWPPSTWTWQVGQRAYQCAYATRKANRENRSATSGPQPGRISPGHQPLGNDRQGK